MQYAISFFYGCIINYGFSITKLKYLYPVYAKPDVMDNTNKIFLKFNWEDYATALLKPYSNKTKKKEAYYALVFIEYIFFWWYWGGEWRRRMHIKA